MQTVAVQATPYSWPHDGALAPEKTALLIIDMQKDFCAEGGYVHHAGYDVDAARGLIPAIQKVRAKLRDWGGLVIHTREGHRPDLSDLPPLKRWRSENAGAGIGSQGPLGKLLIRGEPGWEIVEPLCPEPDEPVIDKPGYSAFHATDLQQILTVRGITHLIFAGVTTDICVNSTLREAVERGFECLTLSDCCAATDPENHAAALRTIVTEGGIFGAVATSKDLVLALSKAAPR
ncbi:isochorismatase family cysteine hydrolase [Methyloligella sp. 2.7D]|uniref:cysteine hydrolase family protein n=1 Tax=unclassified Methyloligella TaxID=2625955 RepID=UPI00157E20BA|nr:isochorismatase family cysteine hydrolase [Methyloligella sp. GL2]QKP78228.1 cysteine hydrolase [Methyloligella sp. GL2]